MATISPRTVGTPRVPPLRIHSSCDFVQTLMKLQRAAQLMTSTLDLDPLLDRVVNDIAASIGCVEVSVWLRDPGSDEMVLHGVRGCSLYKKGARLQIGRQGMVGHVAATGHMHYAPDVMLDPYYVACEPDTRSEVNLPLKANGGVIGVLSVDHKETNAFSSDQLQLFKALAGHIAVAIENARLFKLERQERERMQNEAEEARAVQQALFLKAVSPGPRIRLRDCVASGRSGSRRLVRLHRPRRRAVRHRTRRRLRQGHAGGTADVVHARHPARHREA